MHRTPLSGKSQINLNLITLNSNVIYQPEINDIDRYLGVITLFEGVKYGISGYHFWTLPTRVITTVTSKVSINA
jgi:hypothetical protein